MSVYGYTRVSSETQAQHGLGLEVQAKKIQAYCLDKSLDLDEIFTDAAESGGTPLEDRPAGRTMLSVLQPGDHVVVSALDRAWRSLIDAEKTMATWRQRNITPHLLGLPVDLTSPFGVFFFQILAAFAEMERKLIAERIRGGVREAIAHRGGQWGPYLRYGWTRDDDNKIVPDHDEQGVISLVRALRAEGLTRLRIARHLARLGYTSRNGQPWTEHGIRKVLEKLDLPPPGSAGGVA